MISERNKELCDYLECDDFEAPKDMIDFYLRCRDADLHYADADRYAILNTLFQYDIGMENANDISAWLWEHDVEVYELDYDNCKDMLEHGCKQLHINLNFNDFRTEPIKEYSYY